MVRSQNGKTRVDDAFERYVERALAGKDPSEKVPSLGLEETERVDLGKLIEDFESTRDVVAVSTEAVEPRALEDSTAFEDATVKILPTRKVGDFELIEEVGRGGMGIVFRARQVSLDREVAVKILAGGSFADPESTRRFQREAQAIAKIHDQRIVPIYAVGEEEGCSYFAMPLLQGRSLSERIAEEKSAGAASLAAATAARIALGIAEALDCAHQAGIVHRDVKPSNVFLEADDQPLLIDFGLARDASQQDLTVSAQLLGTPVYMAPERLAGWSTSDPRIDVYGLGATLYEMITLNTPREGGALAEMIKQARDRDPVPPRRLNPELPKDLETICMKSMERDPERRYASAADFAGDLRNFLEHRPITARPAGIGTRSLRFLRRQRLPLATALSAAVMLLAVLALLGVFETPPRPEPKGAVRFFNLTSDLIVERSRPDAGGPDAWESLPLDPKGVAELAPGRARLRVRRRNHFPFVMSGPVDILEDRTTEVEFRSLPIERWSMKGGPADRAPLVIAGRDGTKELLIATPSGSFRFQAHSGAVVGPYVGVAGGPRSEWWELKPVKDGSLPLVGIFVAVAGRVLAMDLESSEPVWMRKEPSFPARLKRVVRIDDRDGDGVRDLIAACADGSIQLIGGADGQTRWVQTAASLDAGVPIDIEFGASPVGPALFVVDRTRGRHRLRLLDLAQGQASLELALPGEVDDLLLVGDTNRWGGLVLTGGGRARLSLDLDEEHWIELFEEPRGSLLATRFDYEAEPRLLVAADGKLFCFDRSGRPQWSSTTRMVPPLRIGVGDLDGRAGDEIVIGGADRILRAHSGGDGSELWSFETRGSINLDPQLSDLDGDGLGEVVAVSADERAYILRGSPRGKLWFADTGWPLGRSAAWAPTGDAGSVVVVGTAGAGAPPHDRGMSGPSVHGFDARTGARRWSRHAEVAFLWCPDVVDLDGDGIADTAAVDRSGRLVAWRVSDGEPTVDIALDSRDAFHGPEPRAADIDGDGNHEIIVCDEAPGSSARRPRLTAWDPRSGEPIWQRTEDLPVSIHRMVVGDLGGDGRVELLLSSRSGGMVILDAANGGILHRLEDGQEVSAPAALGDLNGDGAADLLVGVQGSKARVSAYDGVSLDLMWAHRIGGIDSRPAIVDVDGDGAAEVVVSTWAGSVVALHGKDGGELWSTFVHRGHGLYSSPAVGDLDGDGDVEIVVGAKSRTVIVLDGPTGEIQRRVGTESEVWGSALLADLDSDGRLEIVIGADDGRLHAIRSPRR